MNRADLPAMHFRADGRWVAITWREFGEAARRVAAFLVSEGVVPGDHVAIWSSNRPEWYIADAGVLLARAVPVPIYLTLTAKQGGYELGHSETRVAFVENQRILERVSEVWAGLPALQRVVVMAGLDGTSGDGLVLPWKPALDLGQTALASVGDEVDHRIRSARVDDVATLIYTSGTTAQPKAAQLTHANVIAAVAALAGIFPTGPDDRELCYLPLAHVVERLVSEFCSYYHGNAVWFLDGMENLAARLKEVRPTYFFGVPRVWEKMALRIEERLRAEAGVRGRIARRGVRMARRAARLEALGRPVPAGLRTARGLADRLVLKTIRRETGLDQARYIVSGAAPIGVDTLRFFQGLGLPITEGYGQTENSAIATMNRPGDIRVGTVGPACPDTEIRLDEDGEILVRGPTVFIGYLKDAPATGEALDEGGWLHTGDIGQLDDRGFLRITDRKKDLIITAGGKNIAPGPIEIRLAAHPLVSHAVCIGDRRPFVSALLALDPEELSHWAAERGIPGPPEQVGTSAAFREEISSWVAEVNTELSQVEQVKRWILLPHDFQMGDELTPTLKVMRRVVLRKYAREIDDLYSQPRGG
ncbi:MAG TPA: long-chain fatty acid--CoA ligase [Candidatus Binatia bacterium]|nr:long-chain fatty acid--CoA ligase [Candidatus Binatia bacterium]